ncbi:MAG: hypothetical protein ACLFPQ_05270 [Candidatus Woesearchaeota archaeon]
MENIAILIGKESEDESAKENYDLIMGSRFYSIIYDHSFEKKQYYKTLCKRFAEKIANRVKESDESALGYIIINGYKINHETKEPEKIVKLDDIVLEQFKQSLISEINKSNKELAFEHPSIN